MLSESKFTIKKTGLKQALYYLIDNAVGCLDGNRAPLCTAEDAIRVRNVYKKLGI
jgi:hypothetical protein